MDSDAKDGHDIDGTVIDMIIACEFNVPDNRIIESREKLLGFMDTLMPEYGVGEMIDAVKCLSEPTHEQVYTALMEKCLAQNVKYGARFRKSVQDFWDSLYEDFRETIGDIELHYRRTNA